MSKKLFAMILAIVMILGTLPVLPLFSSAAEGDILGSGYLNNGLAYWQVTATNADGTEARLDLVGSGTLADYGAHTDTPWWPYNEKIVEANVYSVGGVLENVPKNAFAHFPKLKTVKYGEGITTVCNDATAYCAGPITFYFPSTLTNVKQGTVWSTKVAKVYTAGTQEQWNAIKFVVYNDNIINATKEYNTPVVIDDPLTEIPKAGYPTLDGTCYSYGSLQGMENWGGDTQILFGICEDTNETYWPAIEAILEAKNDYRWVLVIGGIDYEMNVEDCTSLVWGSWHGLRFEPANGKDMFIPMKDKTYAIDLKICDADKEVLYYISGPSAGFKNNDYPIVPTLVGDDYLDFYGDGFEYWGGVLYFYPFPISECWKDGYVDQSQTYLRVTDGNMVYTSSTGEYWDSTYDVGSAAIIRVDARKMGWTPVLGKDYSENPLIVEIVSGDHVVATTTFAGQNTAKDTQYHYILDVSCEDNGTATVKYNAGVYTLSVLSVADGYVFAGWVDNMTGKVVSKAVNYEIMPEDGEELSYTAIFEVPANSYTITWIVDGVEYTTLVAEGDVPEYIGTPSKPGTALSGYVFTGWDKDVVAATEDATYTAQFEAAPVPPVKAPAGKYQSGMETWSGNTQLLICPPKAYRDAVWNNKEDYKWSVTLTWEEDGETKSVTCENWIPASEYDSGSWQIIRFTPCLYEDYFDPQAGVVYYLEVTLSQYNPDFGAYQPVYIFEGDEEGYVNADDPVVPERAVAGDINGDGVVNIGDVTSLLNYLAAGEVEKAEMIETNKVVGKLLDVDGKDGIAIGDVTALLNILAEQKA